MTITNDLSKLGAAELAAMLVALRKQKEEVQAALRLAVAEHDRRAMLADMKRRYGDKAVQTITGAGGIASGEKSGS